jgi:DNA-binding NtrC family response regulator
LRCPGAFASIGAMKPLETTWLEQQKNSGARQEIIVLGPDLCTAVEVKGTTALLVGRDPGAQVHLRDGAVSVRHARILIEAGSEGTMLVEDLGSKNGTFLGDRRLAEGERLPVPAGEPITIGLTTIVLQRRSASPRARRIWPHGYFEARLEEQCALLEGTGGTFAIVRVEGTGAREAARVAQLVAPVLRLTDVVAAWAPGIWEILLPYTSADEAESLSASVRDAFAKDGVSARTTLAVYPRDGQTPASLLQFLMTRAGGKADAVRAAAPPGLILEDPEMKRVYATARKVAAGTINVLVLGETGVGKEGLAAFIHSASPRAKRPYLQLNCAAFTESLLESELFGHAKGAFTGATQAKKGLLESANGGTVFLDEIGEMSPALQTKLLRVIETKEVTRVGAITPVEVDVRFVAATHRDVPREVALNRFRSDLYYRLAATTLVIPPLRRRGIEIRPLAEAFLAASARGLKRERAPRLAPAALKELEAYAWPGNVRELRNVMERALLLAEGDEIALEHLPMEIMGAPLALVADAEPSARQETEAEEDETTARVDPRDRWNRAEREERARIVAVLERFGGNQSRAARELGISRGTLIARLAYYEIRRPRGAAED